MALIVLNIRFEHINTSLQKGDLVYYVPVKPVGTSSSVKIFDTGMYEEIHQFGVVLDIKRNLEPQELNVLFDNANPQPAEDDFILFSKNKQANTSSLVGYYANATFVNESNRKAELFTVGSEISPSSK